MEHAVASKLAGRIARIAAVAHTDPPKQPLTPSRDFNQEDRLERLQKAQQVARVALDDYLMALLMGVQPSTEVAIKLDIFYMEHVASGEELGLFARTHSQQ